MTLDPEMELWRKEWSGANDRDVMPKPSEILASVMRYRRRAHLALAANVTFAILLLGASLMTAKRMHSREMVLWAVCVWMSTLIATFIALEGWQRSLVPNMASVADYVVFHRKRALADQWKVRAGVAFLAVQVMTACAWLTTDLIRGRMPLVRFEEAMIVVFLISAAWVYVFVRIWRRSKATLETTENGEPDVRGGSDQVLE
jgi:hypothetical protein